MLCTSRCKSSTATYRLQCVLSEGYVYQLGKVLKKDVYGVANEAKQQAVQPPDGVVIQPAQRT